MDGNLRSDAGFSVGEEYPSVFGSYPGGTSYYIEEDGSVVSHAAFLVREFHHQGLRMKIGLIGSVVTAREYRGRGMARTILRSIMEELGRQGCAIAVLWSDREDFYQPLGFYRGGRELDFRFSSDDVPTVDASVVEFDADRHSHWVWRLYQRHDVRLDRSLEEQKQLCRVPKARIFLTEREGKATSYLAIHKGADFKNYIHEWGGNIDDVQQSVARVQKEWFAGEDLTLIAPKHYDVGPLLRISSVHWDGVLGLIRVLDRNQLLCLYRDYLRSLGVAFSYQREKNLALVGDSTFDVSADFSIIRLVFGDDHPAHHPVLPFFLWGFDSI